MSSLVSAAAALLVLAADAGAATGEGALRSLRLTAGSAVTLEIPCDAGVLLRGTVAPDYQPVVIQLRDPQGELLAEVRNPPESEEPLPVAAVPTRAGTCTLALSLESGPPGDVALRMDPPRPATARDRMQIEGERVHQRAVRLWIERSESSLRQALELASRAAALAHGRATSAGRATPIRLGPHAVAAGRAGGGAPGDDRGNRAPEPARDPRALAEVYNDRAVFETNLSNLTAALEDLNRARALVEPLAHPVLKSVILHNTAFVYAATNEYERALELYRQSERVGAAGKPPSLRAITTDTIGMVLYHLRRYREAERQFRRALQVHRATGDRRHQATSLTHLGWVYGDTKRLAQAEQVYREALELLMPLGDRFTLAFALDGLGEVLALRGRWEEALAQHRAALRTAEQAPDTNQQAISLTNMARALRALGGLDEAVEVIRRAVDLTDSGRLTRPGSSGRTSWTARNRDRYELLVSLLWDLQQRAPDRTGWPRCSG
jgi:tetratricopeptide (TPR) repeat protein